MTRKKILVTGGVGFLGSHLCSRLLEMDCDVFCADNLYTGKKENIAHLIQNPRFNFLLQDVNNPFDINIDEIYHLACPASPKYYQYDPVQTLRTNVLGTMNILDLARMSQAKILQASTSEVYGDPQVHPQVESYWGHVNPIGIRSCYDEGKRCAETLFFDYRRKYNLDIKVIRIFNTYGPKMCPNDGRVISNFIIQSLQELDITIYGDGNQTRSFCFVDDLIDGMIKMMASPKGLTGPINIGNPNEYKMIDIAKKIIEFTQSKSQIIYLPLPENDPKQRKPNIKMANENLNWRPYIDIDEGLKRTIDYFKNYITK